MSYYKKGRKDKNRKRAKISALKKASRRNASAKRKLEAYYKSIRTMKVNYAKRIDPLDVIGICLKVVIPVCIFLFGAYYFALLFGNILEGLFRVLTN